MTKNISAIKKPFKKYNDKPAYQRIERLIENALCRHISEWSDDVDFMTTRDTISRLLKNDNIGKKNMHIITVIRNEGKMKMKFISRKKMPRGSRFGTCYYFDIVKITETKEKYEEFISKFEKYLPVNFIKKIKNECNKKPYNWGE